MLTSVCRCRGDHLGLAVLHGGHRLDRCADRARLGCYRSGGDSGCRCADHDAAVGRGNDRHRADMAMTAAVRRNMDRAVRRDVDVGRTVGRYVDVGRHMAVDLMAVGRNVMAMCAVAVAVLDVDMAVNVAMNMAVSVVAMVTAMSMVSVAAMAVAVSMGALTGFRGRAEKADGEGDGEEGFHGRDPS